MVNETLPRSAREIGRYSTGVLGFLNGVHEYLLDLIEPSEMQEKNWKYQRIHLGKFLEIVDLGGSTVGLH